MNTKKVISVVLCLALLVAAVPCALADTASGMRWLRLGTTSLMVKIDDSFIHGEMTEDDIADDQVAYLYSDETALDFDVYQFDKDGLPEALAEYAAQEASEYAGVTEVVTDGEINGIPVAWYRAVEQYDEGEYDTITYIMDVGGQFAEIVFWLDGEDCNAEAEAIMSTLSPVTMQAIRLGTSPFVVYTMAAYEQGSMTEEEIADDMVAYWLSEDSTLDFDVYQFSKDGLPEALADYAAEEASGYALVSEIVTSAEINGIPVAWYRTVEEYEEAEYDTITYILDNGDEFVEIVFWLDESLDSLEAEAIIHSLTASEA